jgi:hypothetical protein
MLQTGRASLRTIPLVAALTLLLAACGGPQPETRTPAQTPADPELDLAVAWLTGSFSSAAQAAADSSYFDIRLEMVRIWPRREDGVWLYVEQATAAALDRPYRQRVYRVARDAGGRIQSVVFTLPEPDAYIGAWRRPEAFGALAPEALGLREGCAITVVRTGLDAFRGATAGADCVSSLRGAAYATSEVELTADRLTSWDRGFEAEGRQVWGAEAGPYVFDRVSP